jgi:hypothetical protein
MKHSQGSGKSLPFSQTYKKRGESSVQRRKISAKEAVSDIRSGMDDATLMKKYGLSPDGLQSLYEVDPSVKTKNGLF